MSEKEIKLEARLMALERFACHTHNIAIGLAGRLGNLSPRQLDEIEGKSVEQLRLVPVRGAPAHISDVLSDEIFQELKRLVEYARELRDGARE
ncbi:hypothetical protein [Rhizobium brockwellii]|uniref:hypothetical protein n=1 Tax=Rhizobium brockwellii TaxID=3019932 RepID=UPI00293DBC3C|nr:hypothetical protein [Rhizobium brockwellii]MDV4158211.1 hypothetical protein [Rhizobium brockwellii]